VVRKKVVGSIILVRSDKGQFLCRLIVF